MQDFLSCAARINGSISLICTFAEDFFAQKTNKQRTATHSLVAVLQQLALLPRLAHYFCASPCTALRASSILVVHEGTCIPRVGTLDCMLRVRARTFLLPACSLRHIAVQVAMPPWRSARSVMSKWAPQKAADHRPSTAASPPRLALPIKCAQRAPVLDSSLADIGALPAPRTSRDKGTWRSPAQQAFKRRSGGGSPVQSVKLGFACAPQHEPSVSIHAAVPAV